MANFSTAPAREKPVPLIVDLDGTLVATDTLWESIMAFLKANPLHIVLLLRWIVAGKAKFKQRLAQAATVDVECLPYRTECLAWLRKERTTGRTILLATGADAKLAWAVAGHLGLFDGVISSDGKTNATGTNKSDLIAAELGGGAFAYAGNSMVDVEVWRKSRTVVVVAPNRGVVSTLKRQNIEIAQLFPAPKTSWKIWAKALRVHQWVKNILIFTPLATSHRIFDWTGIAQASCGFAVFSLVASSTYLINDLLDLPADRRHASKSKRPLAAGLIAIPNALVMVSFLLLGAVLLSLLLPSKSAAIVFGYSAATLLYSTYLKRFLMADVVTLALFYTARLLYGGVVTGIDISIWTLAFCGFSFFSLASAKRINDLAKANLQASERLRHRAYEAQDLNALVALAAATANIAVLVLILYINSEQGQLLYRHPHFLWTMCVPLLYWFSRMLMLANRGVLSDDPIVFAAKDKVTYGVAASMVLIAVLAT